MAIAMTMEKYLRRKRWKNESNGNYTHSRMDSTCYYAITNDIHGVTIKFHGISIYLYLFILSLHTKTKI